jgi:hypothetical protein
MKVCSFFAPSGSAIASVEVIFDSIANPLVTLPVVYELAA